MLCAVIQIVAVLCGQTQAPVDVKQPTSIVLYVAHSSIDDGQSIPIVAEVVNGTAEDIQVQFGRVLDELIEDGQDVPHPGPRKHTEHPLGLGAPYTIHITVYRPAAVTPRLGTGGAEAKTLRLRIAPQESGFSKFVVSANRLAVGSNRMRAVLYARDRPVAISNVCIVTKAGALEAKD